MSGSRKKGVPFPISSLTASRRSCDKRIKDLAIQFSTYLVILDCKPDSVLVPSLKGVKIIAIVGKHYGVHLILCDLFQGVQKSRDVEIRQKLVTNCFRRHKISNVANLETEAK